MPSLVTLLTDFGLKDGNVGVMKGVIWNIAPGTQIADLSHQISPQNIPEAALILARSAPFYPPGTIHLVVVDPGVGTARRPIAGRIGPHYFVGPDNGVLTIWLEQVENSGQTSEFYLSNQPAYWRPEVSHVFHGRDIFAPLAGHLAAGVTLSALGPPVTDPIRLVLPKPQPHPTGWYGEVIHIDHFGNISTNIRYEHLGEPETASFEIGSEHINGLVHTFGERSPGELIALYGSTGNLIFSVVNGSAADRLQVLIGAPVKVITAL